MIRKKRICRFCEEKAYYIDFKDDKKLMRFTTEQGKIIPKRTSGICSKHQRQLVRAIKRASHLALIPYISQITRENFIAKLRYFSINCNLKFNMNLYNYICNQSQELSENWYIYDRITGFSRCTGFQFQKFYHVNYVL